MVLILKNINISCHSTPSTVGKASVITMNLSLDHWATLGETGTELEENHQVDDTNFKLKLIPHKKRCMLENNCLSVIKMCIFIDKVVVLLCFCALIFIVLYLES